jgi:hypothetical protein
LCGRLPNLKDDENLKTKEKVKVKEWKK